MNHGIQILTIAKTPTSKKCSNKLGLKKIKNNFPEGNLGIDFSSPTGETDGKEKFTRFASTPPFFTKRRKNCPVSPLLQFQNDSNSDNSFKTEGITSLADSVKSVEAEKKSPLQTSIESSIDKTPTNCESLPSDITPDTINLMDSLYGDIWRSTPGLFKKRIKNRKFSEDQNKHKTDAGPNDDLSTQFKSLNVEDDINLEQDVISKSSTNKNVQLGTESKMPTKENSNIDSQVTQIVKSAERTLLKDVINKDMGKRNIFSTNIKKNDEETKIVKDLKPNHKDSNMEFNLKPCRLNFEDKVENNKENVQQKVILQKNKSAINKDKILEPKQKSYSFMASLADNLHSSQRHPKAKYYIENFKDKKDELAHVLFKMFNENVFDSQIYSSLPIFWSVKLQTTAGRAHNKMVKTKDPKYGDGIGRRSRVELSSKVVDNAQRLRDTIAHELCHVASWIIDGQIKDGHGPTWKAWTARVLKRYPEIGSLPVRHNLDIHFKYSYKCIKCGYRINRHSKSINIDSKCCGYCHGKFECIQNKKLKDGVIISTPVNKKTEIKGFALYVKENYGNVRSGNTPHKMAMKYLGQKYAQMKMDAKDNANG